MSGETASSTVAAAAPQAAHPVVANNQLQFQGPSSNSAAPTDDNASSSKSRGGRRNPRQRRAARGDEQSATADGATADAAAPPAAPATAKRRARGRGPPPASPLPNNLPLPTIGLLNINAPNFQPDDTATNTAPPLTAAGNRQPPPKKKKKKPKKPAPTTTTEAAEPSTSHEEASLNTTSTSNDKASATPEPPPQCLLCAEAMQLISFGSCDHRVACGKCCLRMRMCYDRTDCPLCKADLQTVVIAPWRDNIPDFAHFKKTSNASIKTKPGQLGPGIVLVDKYQPGKRPSSTKLLHELVRCTSMSCSVCPPEHRRPFAKPGQLEAHLRQHHNGMQACGMCLREHRNFPLDLPLFSTPAELQKHSAEAHSHCDFCRRAFFDGDALFAHLNQHHFRCQVCEPPPGADHPWFADAQALREHLQADHHACEEPTCRECLVAYATAEELRRHYMQRHSTRMGRWDASTSRPLALDISFARQGGNDGGSGGDNGRRGRGRRGVRGQDRSDAGGGAGNVPMRREGFALETDGGVMMIDDDLGLNTDFSNYQRSNGGGGRSYGNVAHRAARSDWGSSASINAAAAESEVHFPSLAAVAAEAAAAAADAQTNGGGGTRPRPPPLVKHTVRCPCGRRVTYPVVEEGQPVSSIDCDAVCHLEGRRATLADAFGVDNPDRHLSSFDRRPAAWSGALLAAARQNRAFVESIEKELALFIADKNARRSALQPMPKTQRVVVHGMAEQYGLASASFGQEPRRAVELLKIPTSRPAPPDRLLSKTAAIVSDQEIQALLEAADGHAIRFIEIAPTCDLRHFLGRWEGRFNLEWEGGSAAIVRFETEELKKEALDTFGGGIRGIFLIDRQYKPRTAILTNEARGPSSSVGAAAAWGGGSSTGGRAGGGGGGGADSSWTAVAASAPGHHVDHHAPEQSNAAELPKGWAVMTAKRKIVKPRMPHQQQGESAAATSFVALGNLDN